MAETSKHGFTDLYIRLFDLDIEADRLAVVAKTRLPDPPASVRVIPVVFITIPVLNALQDARIEQVADIIVEHIKHHGFVEPTFLQLDADYTSRNLQTYNELVLAVKRRFRNTTISCTVRLHQLADLNKGHFPQAADHLMILTYHTGDLYNPSTRSGILDYRIANSYLSQLTVLPRPTAVALPDFGWTRLYRDGQLVRLLPDPRTLDLSTPAFTVQAGCWAVNRSTWLHGHALYEDDLLVPDTVDASSLLELAQSLDHHSVLRGCQRVMYHLSADRNTSAKWVKWVRVTGACKSLPVR